MEKPHGRWSYREMLEGTSLRGSSSSDLTNISQVNFTLTWVIFQEIPAMKIDFRCANDKNMEISWEKAATTALNALQQLSWPH